MPTYVYACTNPDCGHQFEAVQAFTDDALTVCPVCGQRLRKVFGSVGVVFKGSGFYRNDSREKANNGSAKAESDGDKRAASSEPGASERSGSERGASESGASGTASAEGKSSSGKSEPAPSSKSESSKSESSKSESSKSESSKSAGSPPAAAAKPGSPGPRSRSGPRKTTQPS